VVEIEYDLYKAVSPKVSTNDRYKVRTTAWHDLFATNNRIRGLKLKIVPLWKVP
jgi:hypothetical protein